MNLNMKLGRASTITLIVVILVMVLTSGFSYQQNPLVIDSVPDNIKTLLVDYSQHLHSGTTLHTSFYSGTMGNLVEERRNYYHEFYDMGLHTSLVSISSEFHLEGATITKTGNMYHVELLETVKMFGSPNLTSAEDYPMIPAARWAIAKTDNENVKRALDEYIANTLSAVNDSILNGVETEFRVRHKIDILEGKNNQLQFIKDVFTDKEIDNGDGFDNVNWTNSRFKRSKPDLTQMPDYRIYHTSLDVLGQQLLDDYTKAYGNMTPNGTGFNYSRSAAYTYAKTYSSEATTTTCTGIYQNTSVYNSGYQNVWSYTGCNDCADFISQALRAGGFPTETIWNNTSHGTYAWRVFDFSTTPGLAYYLNNILAAISIYSSNTSLQVGDLMYTDSLHVVMVTAVGPTKYSGHTNDRKNHPYDTSLNHYWHVLNNVP